MNKTEHNQNSCHCLRCRDLPVRVFGRGAGGGQTPGTADSYLMRGVFRDVSLQKHPSRLSVRWVRTGSYAYEVAGEDYVLKPGNFLIINDGQFYNAASDRREISECFTVSFNPQVFTDVFVALSQSEHWLLDNPFDSRAQPQFNFFNDIYQPNEKLKILFGEFAGRAAAANPHQTALDQMFYQLMENLITSQKQIRREIRGIGSAKLSTREELYRRLRRARDFIRAHSTEELKIERIAAVACLSPFHFLRTYKNAFGITPHQELLAVRLDKARQLMFAKENNFSLGRIAAASGFADSSSFSKAFTQKFKIAPSRFDSSGNPTE